MSPEESRAASAGQSFFSTVEGCLISGSHSEMTAAATTTAAGLSHQLTGNH